MGEPRILLVSLASGGDFERIFDGHLDISRGIIQNISTEPITITLSKSGNVQGQGIILGGASAAGEAGGSLDIEKVKIMRYHFTRSTAGLSLAVYIEQD
tara:strand:- start:374 stop:670 length:297 start_codon:yes stop_codon:yes gene_type:complete